MLLNTKAKFCINLMLNNQIHPQFIAQTAEFSVFILRFISCSIIVNIHSNTPHVGSKTYLSVDQIRALQMTKMGIVNKKTSTKSTEGVKELCITRNLFTESKSRIELSQFLKSVRQEDRSCYCITIYNQRGPQESQPQFKYRSTN